MSAVSVQLVQPPAGVRPGANICCPASGNAMRPDIRTFAVRSGVCPGPGGRVAAGCHGHAAIRGPASHAHDDASSPCVLPASPDVLPA